MQTQVSKFSQRLGATALTVAGLIAAATAHAEPGKDSSAMTPVAKIESPRQCSDVDAILARLQYPAGTTFLLTDTGLVVLKQPKAARVRDPAPEPEAWANSGG
jgi:hypothetical protein